jgi:hypothetical protein
VNQRPSGAAVAIDEGMDGLELRMGNGGLRGRREGILIAELAEVVEQAGN